MSASLTLTAPRASTTGDPLGVTLAIDAPPGSTIRVTSPAPSQELVRESAAPWSFQKTSTGWTARRTETWASFAPGTNARLAYKIRIEPRQGPAREANLVSRAVPIVSVLPKGEKNVTAAPLAGPITRPFLPWEVVAAVAVALVAVAIIFRFIGPRRKSAKPKTADEIFDQELSLLTTELARNGPTGLFYDWLAESVRWYLEQKLSFAASKETSWEILQDLKKDPRALPAAEIAQILSACDGYRFALKEEQPERAAGALETTRRAASQIRAALLPPPVQASA